MKKDKILNPELIRLIAAAGHTDKIVIADAGLPVPKGVPVLDLSVIRGLPPFINVLEAVLDELVVEKYCIAEEMQTVNHGLYQYLLNGMQNYPGEQVTHETLKDMMKDAKCVIRTGETTPYANIILYAGVNF